MEASDLNQEGLSAVSKSSNDPCHETLVSSAKKQRVTSSIPLYNKSAQSDDEIVQVSL